MKSWLVIKITRGLTEDAEGAREKTYSLSLDCKRGNKCGMDRYVRDGALVCPVLVVSLPLNQVAFGCLLVRGGLAL